MNPFATKMPDAHWLTEARIKGSKVIVISNDYSPTSRAADEVIVLRTGTDTALAYALAHVIMKEERYQADYVKNSTDLPLLVRMDNGKVLRARDIIPEYRAKPLTKAEVFKPGSKLPPLYLQEKQFIPEAMREEDMNDFVVWDSQEEAPRAITRDEVGLDFQKSGVKPALTGEDQVWEENAYLGKTVLDTPSGERVRNWMPDERDWANPNIGEDEVTEPVDIGTVLKGLPHPIWMFYLPRICNHCAYAACLAACPRQAIYKRAEDGIVLIDPERCEGYQECVSACPYKKSLFDFVTRISQKCIGCFPKIEAGYQPQCVTTCIGRIRLQGFMHPPTEAQGDNPIDFLVHVKKVALPLYPQSGLEPNVYYIPPIHAGDDFLLQMFGPGAAQAVATYKAMRAGQEPTLQALLHLFGSTERIPHRFRVLYQEVIGYDEAGEALVWVPLREPFQQRPHEDEALQVVRQDIP
jgi:nitrate reductase beta subunit